MTTIRFMALALGLLASVPYAFAQAVPPQPSDAAKALVGSWELSNPDRDRRCTLTFKLDPAAPGRSVTFGPTCAAAFPDMRTVAAWVMGADDALKLVDAKGTVLLELTEVENGMYETTPSHTHYFLQTLAATNKDRIADDLFGEWVIVRAAGRPICSLSFENTAYDADSFALTVKPGCDQSIARLAPVAWKLDRGQLVMLSAKGDAWRFEENEPSTWSRVPAARPPIVMVRP